MSVYTVFFTRIKHWLSIENHRAKIEWYGGKPYPLARFPWRFISDRWTMGDLGEYIARSRRIPSWTRGAEALALAQAAQALRTGAIIVEIGSFLGGSTVLLAGARKLRGSGEVHCIDPFDASGEDFSAPVYRAISNTLPLLLRQQFERNVRRAGVAKWVTIHQGTATEIAQRWSQPIDMLFLDGDQSYPGVFAAYGSWSPFLKDGGLIAIHNSDPRPYHEGHDGHRRLVEEIIRPPQYDEVWYVGTTTFARKIK
jgi:MMP 1-O-methyltransferase